MLAFDSGFDDAAFHDELRCLHDAFAMFARKHPDMADGFLSDSGTILDPDVNLTLSGVAALNARIRRKLRDDFPELSQALLGVLYPELLRPFPSATIVEFQLDQSLCDAPTGHALPRGTAIESTQSPDGIQCRFRTTYDVALLPLQMGAIEYQTRQQTRQATPFADAAALIHLEIASRSARLSLAQMSIGRLRFYLHGLPEHMHALHELLLAHTAGLTLSPRDSSNRSPPVCLDKSAVKAVGFEADESLLPRLPGQLVGYHLLSECFAFPRKFLFVDVEFDPGCWDSVGAEAVLHWYVDRHVPELADAIAADTFRLGCTPAINLFEHTLDPLLLDERTSEYRLLTDARQPHACEVYSVDRVTAVADHGEEKVEFAPIFGIRHDQGGASARAYWHASRRPAPPAAGSVNSEPEAFADDPPAPRTETYLALVDLDFSPRQVPDRTLVVSATCTNGDVPSEFAKLELQTVEPTQIGVACLTRPTRALPPMSGLGLLWKLISTLSLNHMSITNSTRGADSTRGAEVLREILRLHVRSPNPEATAAIDAIASISSRRVVRPVTLDAAREPLLDVPGFCRGVEITVELSSRACDSFARNSFVQGAFPRDSFLLASVLDRFFAAQASLNSFTQLVVVDHTKLQELYPKWPPRNGERTLH